MNQESLETRLSTILAWFIILMNDQALRGFFVFAGGYTRFFRFSPNYTVLMSFPLM
jgi:hypothetical protein